MPNSLFLTEWKPKWKGDGTLHIVEDVPDSLTSRTILILSGGDAKEMEEIADMICFLFGVRL